ncbi:phage/plasmid primase, P4 family [uncultured Tessaracoccus sp.]|uniref:phage/plasmid primase, P4 family n=1 Tax=uncultured Tessaracoccus sp. TaxID=905023 RepID=UPI0025E4D672|nr:phage/plasmid primase, P4 family [uncultured Tessaracoccus sp.]
MTNTNTTTLPGRGLDAEQVEALDVARQLVAAGIPLFLAEPALKDGSWDPAGGTGGCGYWLPKAWQQSRPDMAVLERWRPGMALCAVMGHGLDAVDVDPRHGGHTSVEQLQAAGVWPLELGRQSTPSGGYHAFVNSLGVHSLDDTKPGIDVKAGIPGEGGAGFVFLAPTKKRSKVDGQLYRYRWQQTPMLDELDPDDDTGMPLAGIIHSRRDTSGRDTPDLPHDAYDAMPEPRQQAVARYLHATVEHVRDELAEVATRPEGWRDERGRGWEKRLADVCNRFGRLARADWTPWGYHDAYQRLEGIVPAPVARAVGLRGKWISQRGRRTPARWPEQLDHEEPRPELQPAHAGSTASGQLGAARVAPRAGEWSGQTRVAHLLAERWAGRLLHVHGLGWHHWTGTHWAPDELGKTRQALLETMRYHWPATFDDQRLGRDLRACQSAAGQNGALEIAAELPAFAATVEQLDADPYLLNVANGTLDLRTMQLGPHRPEDRVTKLARGAYDPGVDRGVWEAFLRQILPDEQVRAYLARFVGLALLGTVEEQVFTIAIGTGANGKGVFYTSVLYALGDYAHVAPVSLFTDSKDSANRATPDVVALLGRRFVVCSETESTNRLAAATMKNLTGGDTVTARALYGSPITFEPSHTVLMVTNFLPKVSGDDPAVWRRMRVIPFTVTIPKPERDPKLPETLRLHADAILTWAVEGYADYRRQGLNPPEAVTSATDAYQRNSDLIGQFIEECCITSPHYRTPMADLHRAWVWFASEVGGPTLSSRQLGDELGRRGFESSRGAKGVRCRSGLAVASEAQDEAA